ncbi:Thromboxane-A synthase [Halotydeus destructor]|nr:Thromboxane-A synthase [Halotydeus destructor]
MFLQIFVLLIVLATFWYVKRRQKLQVLAKNGIPSAPCSLIYGHINDRYKKNVPKAGEWHAKYGDIFGFYLGTLPMVSVLDVELLKRIQVKDFDKFTDRVQSVRGGPDPLERFADSLVQLRGQRWKEVRSILRSTFSSSKLRDTVPMVHDAIEALLDNLKAKSREGTDFNIYPLLQGLTMDTIGRSAFGVNTEVQRNPDDPFLTAAHALFNDQRGKLAAVPTVLVLLFPEFASILHPLRCLVERFRCWSGTSPNKIMFDVSQKIVNQRRKMGKDPQNPWSRNDLLQRMLEAGISNNEMSSNMEQLAVDNDNATNDPVEASLTRSTLDAHKLTENEVVANSVLFFEAGFETTSTLLAFLFHVLVNQQDIQDKIRQEVTDLYTRSWTF